MSDKMFRGLGIAAAIMIVLSIAVGSCEPTVRFDGSHSGYLVEAIDPASIGSITVAKGDDEVELVRGGDGFLVASKLNYPASNREINSLINKCLKIRTEELLSDDPSDQADLSVVADDEDAQVVRFLDREGKAILGLIAAEAGGEGASGFHVRLDGDDRVYRTSEWLSFRTEPLDYVQKQVVEIQRDDTAKVTVQGPAGEYVIESSEKGQIELRGVPDGKQAKGSEHESVFGAASYLSMTDFMSEQEAKDLSFDSRFTVETRSKAVYVFEIAKRTTSEGEGEDAQAAAKYFVRCHARYQGPDKITMAQDADEEEKQRLEGLALARDAVDRFNERHQSWVYELSSWTAERMVKPFDDLIEDADGLLAEIAASHILIAWEGAERSEVTGRTKEQARERAEEVLAKVEAGEDFAELAREYSDGPSADEGGDLGTFEFDAMAKPFSEAAFALEVGATSAIVETEFGFHVIRRTQ